MFLIYRKEISTMMNFKPLNTHYNRRKLVALTVKKLNHKYNRDQIGEIVKEYAAVICDLVKESEVDELHTITLKPFNFLTLSAGIKPPRNYRYFDSGVCMINEPRKWVKANIGTYFNRRILNNLD